jgi:outer membrane protein TolC
LVLPRPTPLDEEELAALESSPDFQVLDANLKAALREVDRARTRNWPVLSAYVEAAQRDRGGSLFDGSSLTETVNVGVVFDWQIFQGGGVDAAARREINEAMALDAERRQVLQERTGELEAAATGLEALWQNDIALQTVMAARLRALRDVEREQSEGAVSELELALAKLELTRAEVLRRAARRTFLAATIAREWSIGQLDMKMIDLISKLAGRTDEAEQTYRMKRLP